MIQAAIPKKLGGDRTIGLLPMVTRVWATARDAQCMRWSVSMGPFWDTAIRGSSALRQALVRTLLDESAQAFGHSAITALIDVQKFYDSIRHEALIKLAIAEGFPAVIMALEAHLFLTPRCLKREGNFGPPTKATRFIVAGSRRGHMVARIILFTLLQRAHEGCPLVASESLH